MCLNTKINLGKIYLDYLRDHNLGIAIKRKHSFSCGCTS